MCFYSKIIDPLLKDLRDYIPEFAGMKAGDIVLDVCCGTGDQVFHYREKGISAVGIDKRKEMIEFAERKKQRLSLNDVSFYVGNATKLPFEDNSFDFVSVSFGLHEMKKAERDKTILEMKRVVKREGSLIFVDFSSPLPKNIFSFILKTVEFAAGKENYNCFREFISSGGLPNLLKKNNLRVEREGLIKSGIVSILKVKLT